MGIRGAERPSERSVSVPPEVRDGYFDLGDAPGLGIEVDWDLGERYRMPDPLPCPDGMYSDIMFHADNAPDALLCLEEA